MVDVPIPRRPRYAAVDVARGVAIVAMVLYHATLDLGPWFAGLIAVDAASHPLLVLSARLIAGSFLFIVGVSLVLAHQNGIRWRPFLRRLGIIVAAALAVTIVTRIALPDSYVRFGILHAIAAASVIGLAFVRAPIWLTLLAAVAAFAAPGLLASPAFNHPAWVWLGLSTFVPPMMDYVPVLGWIGATLTGIAATRAALRFGLDRRIASWQPASALSRILIRLGRWSLVIYLVHQPILIGLIYLLTLALGRPLPGLF